uniref:Uncharacterized protein n=1 Tax=Aegilops tauschii subsp. strangulata TaxID=200361 RepID=A0A453BCG0_AEGTS
MMKWTHAAGAAETLCEPWVLHRFVRACPWSHEHLSLLVAGPGEQRQLDPGGAPLWDPLRPSMSLFLPVLLIHCLSLFLNFTLKL